MQGMTGFELMLACFTTALCDHEGRCTYLLGPARISGIILRCSANYYYIPEHFYVLYMPTRPPCGFMYPAGGVTDQR